jgi:hypothetical protein
MREIKDKIKVLKSGYNGETALNYQLAQIPHLKYQIFHDIRLPIGDSFFQMDAILLSSKILINLENKNHSGKITIEKNQMIQEAFDKREIFENPISQANRHKILLKDWIGNNNFQPIKMDNLVVFSRPTSEIIIPTGYKDAEHKICKTHNLLKKIEEIETYSKKDWLSEHEVLKLRILLLKSHTPNRVDILKMFNIPESDIIPGVQCPKCLFAPMIYDRNKWICPSCLCISKEAHIRAIYDYLLIIKPWFTNSEIRIFLNLPSSRSATYVVSLLNLPRAGRTSDSIYHQPILFP